MKNIDVTTESSFKRKLKKLFAGLIVASVGYIVSFLIIFIFMEAAGISGWYIVYIPFFR